MASGIASASGSAASGGGTASAIASPPATRLAGSRAGSPFEETAPALISAFRRLREKRLSRRARNASSRSPASPGSTRKVSFSKGSAMSAYENEPPLDPAQERLRRKLVRLLLFSGGIMMLGLIAVFAAIVYKVGETGRAPPAGSLSAAAPAEGEIAVPAGYRLVATALAGERALLTLEGPDGGSLLLLVDLKSGAVLARHRLREE